MEKHWYIITDKRDDIYETNSRQEAKQAIMDGCIVTEVKEQEIYMENGVVRISIHVEMK